MITPSSAAISEHTIERVSYLTVVLVLFIVGHYGLATPFITILFSCLTLYFLGKVFSKSIAIVVFALLNLLLFYLFVHFLGEAVAALPLATAKSVPIIVEWANSYGINLPFTNSESLRDFALDGIKEQLRGIARFAEIFTKESVYLIIGLVAACGLFTTPHLDLGRNTYAIRNNIYSVYAQKLSERSNRDGSTAHHFSGKHPLHRVIRSCPVCVRDTTSLFLRHSCDHVFVRRITYRRESNKQRDNLQHWTYPICTARYHLSALSDHPPQI
jgi:hypothetical protein